ncbi:MAG: carbohydrate-binding protein, partial [Verrucomicrobia bacterium]
MKHRRLSILSLSRCACGRALLRGLALAGGFASLPLFPAMAGDHFSEPDVLSGSVFSATADTSTAGSEAGEPGHGEQDRAWRSYWFTWTAPESGPVRLETTGSAFDTVLSVYTGNALETLTAVAANDDAGVDLASVVTFEAEAGTTYWIAVDGYAGQGGALQLAGERVERGYWYFDDLAEVAARGGDFLADSAWQGLGADLASGLIVEGDQVRGFLGAPADGARTASLWLPLNPETRPDNGRWTIVETIWNITGTAGTSDPARYHLLLFNGRGDLLAGLEFDLQTQALYRLDGAVRTLTGASFSQNVDYRMTVAVDLEGNTWSAWLGTTPVFADAPFNATDGERDFGSLCIARGIAPGASDAGSHVSFADLLVRVDNVVEPRENPGQAARSPFGGQPHAVPGRIEAEDFDEGGEGIGYHDADPDNQGGAYRPGAVDIVAAAGGRQIGYVSPGEWLAYTIEVSRKGRYQIDLLVACSGDGGTMSVAVDGLPVS